MGVLFPKEGTRKYAEKLKPFVQQKAGKLKENVKTVIKTFRDNSRVEQWNCPNNKYFDEMETMDKFLEQFWVYIGVKYSEGPLAGEMHNGAICTWQRTVRGRWDWGYGKFNEMREMLYPNSELIQKAKDDVDDKGFIEQAQAILETFYNPESKAHWDLLENDAKYGRKQIDKDFWPTSDTIFDEEQSAKACEQIDLFCNIYHYYDEDRKLPKLAKLRLNLINEGTLWLSENWNNLQSGLGELDFWIMRMLSETDINAKMAKIDVGQYKKRFYDLRRVMNKLDVHEYKTDVDWIACSRGQTANSTGGVPKQSVPEPAAGASSTKETFWESLQNYVPVMGLLLFGYLIFAVFRQHQRRVDAQRCHNNFCFYGLK